VKWAPFEAIWARICCFQGQEFKTKTGLPFTYSVESDRAVWVKREGKRINQRLAKSNFSQVYGLMQRRGGWLSGPNKINNLKIASGESQVRGSSYVWAILHDKKRRIV